MDPLVVVNTRPLLSLTRGTPNVLVAIVDGPADLDHPGLGARRIRSLGGRVPGGCRHTNSLACSHGTLVLGILAARRDTPAPAICPDCSFLLRAIFPEPPPSDGRLPTATPEDLAEAITDCVEAGARVINISAAPSVPCLYPRESVKEAIDYAARQGVLVVAAAGNQGHLGTSSTTQHPWVISVAACDLTGFPIAHSNFGISAAQHGLLAPGVRVPSLCARGGTAIFGGTSAAAPFVTGTIALLLSLFGTATAAQIRQAVLFSARKYRQSIVPPLLDGVSAYHTLRGTCLDRG